MRQNIARNYWPTQTTSTVPSTARWDHIEWKQSVWEGQEPKVHTVQWVGYVYGAPVGSITRVRAFPDAKGPGQKAGYLAVAKRRGLGVYPTAKAAETAIAEELGEVAYAMQDLFAAMAAYCAAKHDYWHAIANGVATLAQWAADTAEESWKRKREAREFERALIAERAPEVLERIKAALPSIEAFNAKFSSRVRGGAR